MKRVLVLGTLILTLCAACAPVGGQPVFSVTTIPPATSVPMKASARTLASLADRIISFDVSPDGKEIALATSSAALLYDLQTGRLLRSLNDREQVTSVAWSPDGSKLAVGGAKDYGKPFYVGGDSTNSWKAHLTVYDTSNWKVIFQPEFGRDMVNQSFRVLAWSPDSQMLAYSLEIGGVWVINAQTGKLLSEQTDFAGTVVDIAWSPDGTRLLATGDMAYGLRRWRLSDNQSVRLFDRRMSNASSVAWSPDGSRIASGDFLGNACLWTAATNRCDGFLHAHLTTFDVAWSPDGSQLATVGGVIRIWDTHTGKLIKAFGEDSAYVYEQVEWPGANQPLVTLESLLADSRDTVLRLWDISNGSITAEFRGVQPNP